MVQVPQAIVSQAAQRYGLPGQALEPRGGSEGALFRAHLPTTMVALKLLPVPEAGRAVVEERWAFVAYLADHGVRVAQPIPSLSGALIEWVQAADSWWAAVALPWLEGQPLEPRQFAQVETRVLENWGSTMGQMHALAQQYPAGVHLGHWRDEVEVMVALCSEPPILAAWQDMTARLEGLPTDGASYGLVHNDLHALNLIVHQGEVTVLDFDVCGHHWFVCDIAIALQTVLWTRPAEVAGQIPGWRRMWTHFWRGYCQENPLDGGWLGQIGLFLNYRRLLLYSVFRQEWRGGLGWQQGMLRHWQDGILSGQPVVAAPWWLEPDPEGRVA